MQGRGRHPGAPAAVRARCVGAVSEGVGAVSEGVGADALGAQYARVQPGRGWGGEDRVMFFQGRGCEPELQLGD